MTKCGERGLIMLYNGNAEAFKKLKEISVLDIQPLRIGQVEDTEAATGMTVLICDEGMRAGLDVRGGGPASRDSRWSSREAALSDLARETALCSISKSTI